MNKDQHELSKNADYALAVAERVLAANVERIPANRVTQFVVGWTRAAFDQSCVIATLTKGGLARAASPNRRSFAEIVVRLQWLFAMPQVDRASALDAMLDHERQLTEKSLEHIRDMGFDSARDLKAMREFVLDAAEGPLKNEARSFLSAAQSTEGQSVGLYYAWREETQYTHATGAMAVAYAPATAGDPFPSVADAQLTGHVYALFLLVTITYKLLVAEGVETDDAMALVDAFLGIT